MCASSLNEESPFDQKFFKVNESAVASSQVSWLQSPRRENNKVLSNTWRSATFQHHLACRGGGRGGGFYKCSLIRDMAVLLWDVLNLLCVRGWRSHRRATDVAAEGAELLRAESRCVLSGSGQVLCVFCVHRWQDGVFARRGLHGEQRGKLKQLLSSQFIGFHNVRGLKKTGVRVSRRDYWTGMSPCLLMGLFWKLICCDHSGSCSGMCQYLSSPCWSLMIIYVAGCS